MKVTVTDLAGKQKALPKLTLELSGKQDAIMNEETPNARFELMYAYIEECFGHDYTAKALDGETVYECDITALAVLYSRIVTAYQTVVANDAVNQVEGVTRRAASAMSGAGNILNMA